jgi:hypothetical protein
MPRARWLARIAVLRAQIVRALARTRLALGDGGARSKCVKRRRAAARERLHATRACDAFRRIARRSYAFER